MSRRCRGAQRRQPPSMSGMIPSTNAGSDKAHPVNAGERIHFEKIPPHRNPLRITPVPNIPEPERPCNYCRIIYMSRSGKQSVIN